jgi:hypothetical protein
LRWFTTWRFATSLVLLSTLAVCGCGNSGDPFSYVPASGKITYEDGSLIPASDLHLNFISEKPPVDSKTYPRVGMARVDVASGKFGTPTTHKANDGLIRGKHKVTITTLKHGQLPAKQVPPEYFDAKKTPLEVDTEVPDSFNLKVRKPK